MSSFIRILFTLILCFFLFAYHAYAVSVTITDSPSSIGSDPFALSVAVAGATPGTNYLRVDLYQEGTTTYFGETYNGTDWYGGSDGSSYFPITVGSDKTWSGTLQARIGSTIPKEYTGTGVYYVRIRRYTAGGNYTNDEAKASAVQVSLLFPTSTPMPTTTPTPAPTMTSVPTMKPTPTTKPQALPTSTKSTVNTSLATTQRMLSDAVTSVHLQSSISPTKMSSIEAEPTAILGISTKSAEKKSMHISKKQVLVKGSSTALPQIIAVSIGGALFIACSIVIYLKKVRN